MSLDRFTTSADGYQRTMYGGAFPRQPIVVQAGPWTSDTMSLARDGWQFATEYDIPMMAHRVVIGRGDYQCMMMVSVRDEELHQSSPLRFEGQLVGKAYVRDEIDLRRFTMVDILDAYHCEQEAVRGLREISPRDLFPQSAKADEGTIVLPDEQTVEEVLDLLLQKQAPRQKEIRANQRRTQHASIITLDTKVA